MKAAIRIAKIELGTMFFSPIAWFLLVVFIFQCGLEYTGTIAGWVVQQELDRSLTFLTQRLVGGNYSMLGNIIGKLYLYLPLLTMGLMSREFSSGTIKLLYSSPVRIRGIIAGKFMAMMVYCFLLLMVLTIFMVAAGFNIKSADTGEILSALLGVYLLLCTYSAIGLFMSCLTSYQVVAAISTLVLFAVLNFVGTMWQDMDFVRDLTYFLSISGRVQNMTGGLISTKDVIYFLVIIYIFLGLAIYRLKATTESTSFTVKAGRYALIIVSALMIGYITSRPAMTGYYDATATKTRTLTPNAQKAIKELGSGVLTVTSYINMLDGRFAYGSPKQRNIDMARWEPFVRFKPDIKFEYVYYYDSIESKGFYKANQGMTLKQIAEKQSKTYQIEVDDLKSPEEIHKIIDLRPESNRYVMQLKFNGKTTFLRLYDDMLVFPSETETAAALKRLMVKLPRIAFVEGELERSIDRNGDRDYKMLTNTKGFRYALLNQGFDVERVVLDSAEIPAGIAALVIADPKKEFTPAAFEKIKKYIEAGGNLLIAGEPGKQSVLNPVLDLLGVKLMDGLLVQYSKDYSPDLLLPMLTDVAGHLSKSVARSQKDSLPVSMPGAAALSYTSTGAYFISPLLMTNGKLSWRKKGLLVTDSSEVVYNAADGDEKGSYPTAVSLTRKVGAKEQRIVVTGDADFMSNAELMRWNVRNANFGFNTAIFGWFSDGQFPIDTSRPDSPDDKVLASTKSMKWMKILYLGILPGLVLLIGTVLLVRRRKK